MEQLEGRRIPPSHGACPRRAPGHPGPRGPGTARHSGASVEEDFGDQQCDLGFRSCRVSRRAGVRGGPGVLNPPSQLSSQPFRRIPEDREGPAGWELCDTPWLQGVLETPTDPRRSHCPLWETDALSPELRGRRMQFGLLLARLSAAGWKLLPSARVRAPGAQLLHPEDHTSFASYEVLPRPALEPRAGPFRSPTRRRRRLQRW